MGSESAFAGSDSAASAGLRRAASAADVEVAEEDWRALALPRAGGTPLDAAGLREVGVNPNPVSGKSLRIILLDVCIRMSICTKKSEHRFEGLYKKKILQV